MVRKRLGLVPKAARNCRASVQRSRPDRRSSAAAEWRPAGVGGDPFAHPQQRRQVEQAGTGAICARCRPRCGAQQPGQRRTDIHAAQLVHRVFHVQRVSQQRGTDAGRA